MRHQEELSGVRGTQGGGWDERFIPRSSRLPPFDPPSSFSLSLFRSPLLKAIPPS